MDNNEKLKTDLEVFPLKVKELNEKFDAEVKAVQERMNNFLANQSIKYDENSFPLKDSVGSNDGLILPEPIKPDLNLESLVGTEDLVLPKNIEDDLNLESSQEIESGLDINELIEKSMSASVKPGIKVKNKQKKLKVPKKVAKYALTVALISSTLTVGTKEVINHHYQNQQIKEEVKEYKEIYHDNFIQAGVKYDEENYVYNPIHDHDFDNLIKDTYERYADPLVGFYMLYTNLDDSCKKNNIYYVLQIFNKYYQTDYKSIDDLLTRNNLKNLKELREVVGYSLSALDEGKGR